VDGRSDVEPPAEVRLYLFAGAQHIPGTLPRRRPIPTREAGPASFNVVDYAPLLRAALVNLDRWASAGRGAAASAVPRLADGTAVAAASVTPVFARIPA